MNWRIQVKQKSCFVPQCGILTFCGSHVGVLVMETEIVIPKDQCDFDYDVIYRLLQKGTPDPKANLCRGHWGKFFSNKIKQQIVFLSLMHQLQRCLLLSFRSFLIPNSSKMSTKTFKIKKSVDLWRKLCNLLSLQYTKARYTTGSAVYSEKCFCRQCFVFLFSLFLTA